MVMRVPFWCVAIQAPCMRVLGTGAREIKVLGTGYWVLCTRYYLGREAAFAANIIKGHLQLEPFAAEEGRG